MAERRKRHAPVRKEVKKGARKDQAPAGNGLLASHLETLADCLRRLLKAPLTSTLTVFVIAIALFLPGLFGLVAENLAALGTRFQESASITLFLIDSVSEVEALRLGGEIVASESVVAVDYTTREQALAEFRQRSGFGGILTELGSNPLPASLAVTPASSALVMIEKLAEEFEALPQVEAVAVDLRWMQRLSAIQATLENLALLIKVVLGLAVIFIVGNTIRSSVEHRKQEIEVLRLVGATAGYIARPFLYSGLLLGFSGALLACVMLVIFQLALGDTIDNLLSLYDSTLQIRTLALTDAIGLLVSGSLLGCLGAAVSAGIRLLSNPP
ncbi:MAG: permease-like cell division protein FtsX [Gammaproteobacteria bacterium]|jgi:cell division transport system permease protein